MNFGFSAEQEMLREQVRRFMQKTCPMKTVRAVAGGDTKLARALWGQTRELGLHGLIVPEAFGGVGLGWVDLVVVLEETGRGLSPIPIALQALAASAILLSGSDAQKRAWLPGLAAGEEVWTLALYDEPNWIAPDAVTLGGVRGDRGVTLNGVKAHVWHAAAADQLLVAFRTDEGIALARVDRERVIVTPQPGMDATKANASATFETLFVPDADLIPLDEAAFRRINDLGALAVAAEMVGAAEAALLMTSNYARERIQFGKPIGQYQGVKHRLADMFVDTESFKSLVYFAAWAADYSEEELPRAVSLAKGYASDAFARIGIECVGLHGAIGYTAEFDIQLYLKRSKWARPMFGDSDYHLDRVAAVGGL